MISLRNMVISGAALMALSACDTALQSNAKLSPAQAQAKVLAMFEANGCKLHIDSFEAMRDTGAGPHAQANYNAMTLASIRLFERGILREDGANNKYAWSVTPACQARIDAARPRLVRRSIREFGLTEKHLEALG